MLAESACRRLQAARKVMSEEIDGSPRASSPKVMGSWASMVQNKQVLKKFDINVKTSEGQSSVEIPDEVFENATPIWEDFLVGKFLDTAPHVAKVHVILNKIWRQGTESQRIDVYEVNSTTLRFRVCDPMVRARVLKRGMWNIAEVPMVVAKWSPITEKDQPEEKSIPLWVYLKKVPMNMFSWEGLSFISSAVGHPVRLHPETVACSNFDVAKVFVNADLSKVLPKRICFSKNGKDFWVDFFYPWLPPRCTSCDKWGHLETRCVVNSKNSETSNQKKSAAEVIPVSDLVLETTPRPEIEKEEERVNTDTGKEKNVSLIEPNNEKAGQWSTIPPSKAGRSPYKNTVTTYKESSDSIASASKFAVLSIGEEEEEEGELRDNVDVEVDEEVTVPIEEEETETIVKEAEHVEGEIEHVVENLETTQIQSKENTVATGVMEQEKHAATRTYKKKQKGTSATSTHVTREAVPVTSNKRSTRRNL